MRLFDNAARFLASLAAGGRTVVVVTHERDTFTGVQRTLTLVDGAVAS